MPASANYGAALHDYVVAITSPFCWLAFLIGMAGKIAWLQGTAPLSPGLWHGAAEAGLARAN